MFSLKFFNRSNKCLLQFLFSKHYKRDQRHQLNKHFKVIYISFTLLNYETLRNEKKSITRNLLAPVERNHAPTSFLSRVNTRAREIKPRDAPRIRECRRRQASKSKRKKKREERIPFSFAAPRSARKRVENSRCSFRGRPLHESFSPFVRATAALFSHCARHKDIDISR